MSYRTGIFFALLLHFLLLLTMFSIHWSNNQAAGAQHINFVKSYVYAQKQLPQAAQQQQLNFNKKVPVRSKNNAAVIHAPNLVKVDNHIHKQTLTHTNAKTAAKKSIAANLTQGQYNQLLVLLHNAIAKKQVYPASAQALQQQGSVVLSFILSISGKIDHIKIIKSSGFGLLDNAAIVAVQNVSPFTAMKLQTAQQLKIKIDFYL